MWLIYVKKVFKKSVVFPDLVTAGTAEQTLVRGYMYTNPLSGKTVRQQPRSSLWRRSSLAPCPVCRSQMMGSPHTAQGGNILLLLYSTANTHTQILSAHLIPFVVMTRCQQMCDDWLLTCSVSQPTVGLTPEQIAMAARSRFIALNVMKPGSNSSFKQKTWNQIYLNTKLWNWKKNLSLNTVL